MPAFAASNQRWHWHSKSRVPETAVVGATKKGAPNHTAPTTPTKGRTRTAMADAPQAGGGPELLLVQEPFGSGWSFGGKQN